MIFSEELPRLVGQRVVLREPRAADQPNLFLVFSDQEVTRYWSRPPMRDPIEAKHNLEEIIDGKRTKSLFQWSLADKQTDNLIGTCTLFHCDTRNRRAELGYALLSKHWRQGLMTEALNLLLEFAFYELNLHRLEADVDPRNEASLKLLCRLGFQREGIARQRWLLGGEALDSVMLGLLASEWNRPAPRAAITDCRGDPALGRRA